MHVTRITQTYRNIKRFRHILKVLLQYGFDDVLSRLRIDYFVKLRRRVSPKFQARELKQVTAAARLRMAMEELGPTFMKLGQILSIRPDLIPQSFVDEFQKLQDEAAQFPVEKVKELILAHLGNPVEILFRSFQEVPIAAASIAQVHKAVTVHGDPVVVKIQRPDIRQIIETDLSILYDLAGLIERYIPESEPYHPVGIVEEFAKTIRRELDFIREARNIDRFRRNFENDKTVYVIGVHWELSTESILTMEYVDGIKASDFERMDRAGLDRKVIAVNGARAILKQIFEHGFFHADPHPGNFFILEDHVIAPLDYGMMGSLDEDLRNSLSDLLTGIVKKDVNRIIRVFADIGIIEDGMDTRGIKLDLYDFLDRYYQIPLAKLDVAKIIREFTEIIRKHRIRLPTDLTLMARALVIEEGLGRRLDPDFDMIAMARPYVQKLLIRKLDPRRHVKEFTETMDDFVRLARVLPSEMRSILLKVKKGDLTIKFEHQRLDHFIQELDKASNRLSFSLVIASIIIASSLMVQLDKGPLLLGLPVFGILGYLIAGILGLWLVIAIIRSGRL